MNDVAKDLESILTTAKMRSKSQQFTYVGALTPEEAFEVLEKNNQAILVDVRSKAELDLVGRVPNAIHIEWASYPGMVANPNFSAQLQAIVPQDASVIFMCRTGGRSHNAASVAASLGYKNAFNMLEGFEGEANAFNQRTLINGWKFAGLPWTN
jgi:rhodanese-related sulfurtransferase